MTLWLFQHSATPASSKSLHLPTKGIIKFALGYQFQCLCFVDFFKPTATVSTSHKIPICILFYLSEGRSSACSFGWSRLYGINIRGPFWSLPGPFNFSFLPFGLGKMANFRHFSMVNSMITCFILLKNKNIMKTRHRKKKKKLSEIKKHLLLKT